MTDRKLPELFAERPIRSDFARPRRSIPYSVRRLITVLVLAAIIGGGLYWKYGAHSSAVPGEIPTIKSEGAYKQRPEQPGGLEIPNQDVQVYQQIGNNPPAQPQVEHLLPPPETPIAPPPQSAAAPPTPEQLESLTPEKRAATTATQPEAAPAPVPAAAPIVPVAPEAAPVPAVEATPAAAPAPAPVAKAVPAPVKTQATAAPKSIDDVLKNVTQTKATGSSVIQVAAVQNQNDAQALMAKLQSQYSSILGGTQLHIVKADLGTKGVYYRIQSQGMSSDQANKTCAALKNAKAGCIIVHP